MHLHPPFHPFQHVHPLRPRPLDATGLETLNLALILLGAVLVLLLNLR
jgi:hypothetical protein